MNSKIMLGVFAIILLQVALVWIMAPNIMATSQAEGASEKGERGILSACAHGAGNTHMEGRARPLNQTCG
jgi:hypothetical protein